MDCSPQALITSSGSIRCCLRGWRQRLGVKIYLRATIAGVSTDPAFLRDQARCLNSCVANGTILSINTYLMTLIAGSSTDRTVLLDNAKCFRGPCMLPVVRDAIQVWLLTQIAGVSADPATLLDNARCIIKCIPGGEMRAVETYLLCKLAGV